MDRATIEFEYQNRKKYESFFKNSFVQRAMKKIFAGYSAVSADKVFVYNMTAFRGSYIIDLIIDFQGIIIPLNIKLFEKSVSGKSELERYNYTTKFNIKEEKYQTGMFPTIISVGNCSYNHDIYNAFFDKDDLIHYNYFYSKFYSKERQSIQYSQTVHCNISNDDVHRDIFFDVTSFYVNDNSSHFINMYTDLFMNHNKPRLFNLNVRSLDAEYSGICDYPEFKTFVDSEFDTVAEFFRNIIIKKEKCSEEIIPSFDNYIDLFDYYNAHADDIRTIKEMSEI